MATSFQELLASKKADAHKLAAEGAGAAKVDVARAINQATGMQSSTSPSVSNMPVQMKSIKGELDTEKAATCLAVYEDNDFRPLKTAIKAKGGKVVAQAGFFYATLQEEVDVLEQYADKKIIKRVTLATKE